ncbi:MAG: flavin reductase [Gemmatimonadales bacterium]|jgi:flavin reductase (DIM6/NTAB) family NADH-FMN oxidoreductase RutF|nr:MAG: flavin reductase [Gemmatimonadales bacterium]
MESELQKRGLVSLELTSPIWERFYMASPLVIVGTLEEDGAPDLAPKHMVTPLGWDNYVGFVCSPSHATYLNAVRNGEFTLSFPRPGGVISASMAAAPRCGEDHKPSLDLLETFQATQVRGPLVADCYLHLECTLHGTWDVFGLNSLVAGSVVAAHVSEDGVRRPDRDDGEVVAEEPLLVYLPPGRYARVSDTQAFPFHRGMKL